MLSLRDDARAAAFARNFLVGYLNPSFGAISKAETGHLVFALLIEAGEIDPAAQAYDIARALNVTPTRARNLLFHWQLRGAGGTGDLDVRLAAALARVRFARDGDFLSFGIDSPLLREELRARFRRIGIFADASFSGDIVRVPVDHFVVFLDGFLKPEVKDRLMEHLLRDRQVEDRSFRSMALRVLKGLAAKALGRAGETVVDAAADRLAPFIAALLAGDGKEARRHSEEALA